MDNNLEFLQQALGVLTKINTAIQVSNMKDTILHVEVREILKKAKELEIKPICKQYDKENYGRWS